jgi:hypothetical protein
MTPARSRLRFPVALVPFRNARRSTGIMTAMWIAMDPIAIQATASSTCGN